MGNTNSPLQQKYNKTFTKDEINDVSKFDRTELSNYYSSLKSSPTYLEIIDKGINLVNEKDNVTLKINDLNNVMLHDKNLNVNYNLTSSYEYPLKKYCVNTNNEKKYCSCDLSIIDLTMDITELKSKL